MHAIILDDEKHCIETLESMLGKYTDITIARTFTDPIEALKAVRQINADILFIDIEMPHLNGFEFLAAVPDHQWQVIFTTAYDAYAVQAFKIKAIDYLLKPISRQDLIAAVEKCRTNLDAKEPMRPISDLSTSLSARLKKIAVPTMAGLELLPVEKVVYVVSESNYVNILLANGEKLLVSKTLKTFEAQLTPYGFIRVHHSYLVNPDYIQRYVRGDGGYLVLENGETISVSRSRKQYLLEKLNGLM